jgi:hypothetical protein
LIHYWLLVLVRAFSDSLDSIGHPTTTIGFAMMVIIGSALWSWSAEKSEGSGWKVFVKRHLPREILRVVPVAVIAWTPFFLWFLFATPYKMELEGQGREANLQTVVNSQTTAITGCSTDLSAAQVARSLLSNQVNSQQQTIDSDQMTINAQQSTVNAQQDTVSTCVVKLSQLNSISPKYEVAESVDEPSLGKGEHSVLFVVTTSKLVATTKFIITCKQDISRTSYSFANGSPSIGSAILYDQKTIFVNTSSPAWTPEVPILVRAIYTATDTGPCALRVF